MLIIGLFVAAAAAAAGAAAAEAGTKAPLQEDMYVCVMNVVNAPSKSELVGWRKDIARKSAAVRGGSLRLEDIFACCAKQPSGDKNEARHCRRFCENEPGQKKNSQAN